jgi:hypothetical protein
MPDLLPIFPPPVQPGKSVYLHKSIGDSQEKITRCWGWDWGRIHQQDYAPAPAFWIRLSLIRTANWL